MPSLIFLIGMPGSGKSYWGSQLSVQLGWNCYDLDALIEEKENQSITEIFSQKGESYFREKETKLLRTFKDKEACVVAIGGGTPCFDDNMQWMNEHGITIWIDEPLETLAERLIKEKAHRPLLNNLADTQILAYLQKLYTQRSAFYNKATYHLTEDTIGIEYILSICQ